MRSCFCGFGVCCPQTLVLLRELVRFGSDRVVEETRDHMYNLRGLENFRYQEEGKEKGNGIREISKVRERESKAQGSEGCGCGCGFSVAGVRAPCSSVYACVGFFLCCVLFVS